MIGNVSRSINVSQDNCSHSNTKGASGDQGLILYTFQLLLVCFLKLDSMFKREVINGLRSVRKQLSSLTKKVDFLSIPSSPVCSLY